MKKLFVTMMAAMVAMFVASPAMAQATRTWVSGVGDDANPCSRTAPCKTFAGAISKTATGGEINCLDPGGFGTVTINKSLTIDCSGTLGGILAANTFGINVNDSSSPTPGTAKVEINGLDINGVSNSTSPGTDGIRVVSARYVMITNTTLRNFATAGVTVKGTTKVRVTVDHSYLLNNGTGILVAPPAALSNAVEVSNTTISVSTNAGISLVGPLASGYLSNSVINDTLKSLDIQSGAVLNSYGNNVLAGTATDTPTPTPLR